MGGRKGMTADRDRFCEWRAKRGVALLNEVGEVGKWDVEGCFYELD